MDYGFEAIKLLVYLCNIIEKMEQGQNRNNLIDTAIAKLKKLKLPSED